MLRGTYLTRKDQELESVVCTLEEQVGNFQRYRHKYDQTVSMHLMIAVQKFASSSQNVPRQSPGPGGH
jgi:hypothetical protein